MTAASSRARVRKPVAFLAHSFAAEDTVVVAAVRNTLRTAGWSVATGKSGAPVGIKVRTRIAGADIFVALFTRRHRIGDGYWTTSPWVIEEKGYSFGTDAHRPLVLLLEHGIPSPAETGGLNGDLEYIPFDRYRLDAAAKALRAMLRSIELPHRQ
jgi:hypothetical protein